MELSVYNIQGSETGKKVNLDDSIFGIEPNDHAIYLDTKQYLANKRQGTSKAKERSEVSGSTRKLKDRRGPEAPGSAISKTRSSEVEAEYSARGLETIISNLTRKSNNWPENQPCRTRHLPVIL